VNPEILATALLWVMMPLDATPPDVRPSDVAVFPPPEVVKRETDAAWERHQKVVATCRDANYPPGWTRLGKETARAFNTWNQVHYIQHSGASEYHRLGYLRWLRDYVGPLNYYHGVLPSPVHVPDYAPEVPPKKAGEK
jgi:hypothetical protein